VTDNHLGIRRGVVVSVLLSAGRTAVALDIESFVHIDPGSLHFALGVLHIGHMSVDTLLADADSGESAGIAHSDSKT
jgi:hypothetical protein